MLIDRRIPLPFLRRRRRLLLVAAPSRLPKGAKRAPRARTRHVSDELEVLCVPLARGRVCGCGQVEHVRVVGERGGGQLLVVFVDGADVWWGGVVGVGERWWLGCGGGGGGHWGLCGVGVGVVGEGEGGREIKGGGVGWLEVET